MMIQLRLERWGREVPRRGNPVGQPHVISMSALQPDMEIYGSNESMGMALAPPAGGPQGSSSPRFPPGQVRHQDREQDEQPPAAGSSSAGGSDHRFEEAIAKVAAHVGRSHSSPALNTRGALTPDLVDHPVIRQEFGLSDGIGGSCHGGPGIKIGRDKFENNAKWGLGVFGGKKVEASRAALA